MKLFQTIWVACRALLRNKMRSFLTTLGIVIGVAAVISMSAIGAGARARVAQTFESMGSNMLIVFSGSSRMGGMRGGAGSQPSLTWDDLEKIRTEVPAVKYAAPMLGTAAQVMAAGQHLVVRNGRAEGPENPVQQAEQIRFAGVLRRDRFPARIGAGAGDQAGQQLHDIQGHGRFSLSPVRRG